MPDHVTVDLHQRHGDLILAMQQLQFAIAQEFRCRDNPFDPYGLLKHWIQFGTAVTYGQCGSIEK